MSAPRQRIPTVSCSESSRFLGDSGSMPGKMTLARPRQVLRDVLRRGEDGVVVVVEIGRQEVPGGPRGGVALVQPDVAAPQGHEGHRRAQEARQREGLRIVDDQHVARLEQRLQPGGVLPARSLEDLAIRRAESRVARAMDEIVESLRQREEGGVAAADDHPFRADAQVPEQPDDRGKHLGDAAARRRRVHVPDRPPGESRDEAGGLGHELRRRRREVRHGGVVVERVLGPHVHAYQRRQSLDHRLALHASPATPRGAGLRLPLSTLDNNAVRRMDPLRRAEGEQ